MGKKIVAPVNLEDIQTSRQLANLYCGYSVRLENCFIKHRLLHYERLYKDEEKKDAATKKINDQHRSFHRALAKSITKSVREKLSDDDLKHIREQVNEICIALFDFASALQAFNVVLPYILKHNKVISTGKKRALMDIDKLKKNPALLDRGKETVKELQESIGQPLNGGSYYPLYFFAWLKDLGYIPGQRIDEVILSEKLAGIRAEINIKFARNARQDLFLFQALQLVVYEILREHVKKDNCRRYYHEHSTRNHEAEETTASLINSYIQQTIKGLPLLTSKSINTTLRRNPA